MARKIMVFLVEKTTFERGVPLVNQYVVEGRSRKDALEQVIDREGITIMQHDGVDVEEVPESEE